MGKITQKRLKEIICYDSVSGIFTWRKSCGSRAVKGSVAGTNNRGYIQIKVDKVLHNAHRLAWLYVYGYLPEGDVHHIDGNKGHNQISNLEELSRSCHTKLTESRKDNTSGIKGISWDKNLCKWRAQMQSNGKRIHLCISENFLETVCHRLAAEQAENWPGSYDSSPSYRYVMNNL